MRKEQTVLIFIVTYFAFILYGFAENVIQPKAPIKQFRIPSFGDNGYIRWVLRGEEGIYRNAEDVSVSGMALRIYSSDERKLLQLSMDSPQAEIEIGTSRAFSEAPIEITGSNFEMSGTGWKWLGDERSIEVKRASKVVFAQGLAATFGLFDPDKNAASALTTILSDRLRLHMQANHYEFEFSGQVTVRSGESLLRCGLLKATAEMPSSNGDAVTGQGDSGRLESIRTIEAQGSVAIEQVDRVVRAERLESDPLNGVTRLSGSAEVELPGAFIFGDSIETRPGQAVAKGNGDSNRAKMILLNTGALGIGGPSQLSEETLVLADTIMVQEDPLQYVFIFKGQVEVLSGGLAQQSEMLTVYSRKGAGKSRDKAQDPVAEVTQMVAEGSVRIERDGQQARAEKVCYDPLRETAELTGTPEFSDGDSTISGDRIDLQPGSVVIYGNPEKPVIVELPSIEDLGYVDKKAATESAESDALLQGADQVESDPELTFAQPVPTFVRSRRVEIRHGSENQEIDFRDNVHVTGTNLEVHAERMEVLLRKTKGLNGSGFVRGSQVEQIIARDAVRINQGARKALCGTAELIPSVGEVILTENARVFDGNSLIEGHRIVLNKGKRLARVEGRAGEGDGRARITIPPSEGDISIPGF